MMFKDQIVLVTGASRGIGRATAVAFSNAGAKVVINYRVDQSGAEETCAEIEASGGQAISWQADLSDPADLKAMVAGIETSIGPISVLVNNAAAFNNDPFLDLELEEFDRLWATNARGLLVLSQLVARKMVERKSGNIIHVSSILARQVIRRRSAYIATKGAVESLTRAMSVELAEYNIRVNAVIPGLVNTAALRRAINNVEVTEELERYIPIGRLGDPDEMARVITFLASPDASYITGALIPVDGGLSAVEAGPP
ncbi:MAG TPA: glucose 1-dehydrogenase [candidate division Zixibacteria bacterium]|nr:glucose 1-dehydrogenase [candidate division Zixibacteria bacterium]